MTKEEINQKRILGNKILKAVYQHGKLNVDQIAGNINLHPNDIINELDRLDDANLLKPIYTSVKGIPNYVLTNKGTQIIHKHLTGVLYV